MERETNLQKNRSERNHLAMKDNFFSSQWLEEEVGKQKLQPLPSGETPWYLLAGTGFYVREQIGQFLRNTSSILLEITPDIVAIEAGKIKVDIEAFEDEYLKQMPCLKFNLAWQDGGRDKKIVCPDYNNVTWESVTDSKERDGSVAKARAGVEDWLKTAPADSFALVVSPEGWSGLSDVDGNSVRYTSTQVYAFHTLQDGSLEAYTFRFDADIWQNEKLQRSLGLTVSGDLDPRLRIKNAVANVALISGEDPQRSVRSFNEIVDKIQASVDGRQVAYDGKTFAEIKALLNNPKRFNQKNFITSSLIQRFQEYANKRILTSDILDQEKDLQIALGITIAQLHNSYSEAQTLKEDKVVFVSESARIYKDEAMIAAFVNRAQNINYGHQKEQLALLPGCAGGGQKTIITSMGIPRVGEIKKGINDSDEQEWFKCPRCKYQADGPVGDTCPNCDLTKEQFAEDGGEIC